MRDHFYGLHGILFSVENGFDGVDIGGWVARGVVFALHYESLTAPLRSTLPETVESMPQPYQRGAFPCVRMNRVAAAGSTAVTGKHMFPSTQAGHTKPETKKGRFDERPKDDT